MKKLYTLSFAIIAITGYSQTIPFTGTGALTANGWTLHSGAVPSQLQTLTTVSDSGNSLSFAGLPASTANRTSIIAGNTEDDNFPLTAPLTGVAYYSALIKPLDIVGMQPNTSTVGDYFLAFGGTAGASVTNLPARVYVKAGSTANNFVLGVLNNSGGTATPAFTGDLPIATTHFIVVKLDLATNTASLFVNPTPGALEPAATATNATGTTAAPTQLASVAIRQGGNATAGTGNVEIDEIRAGATWADVTPAVLAVKQNEISGLNIFPNPVTNGVLFINTTANETKKVTIIDVLGKVVLNTTISGNSVNVSDLNSGVYIVKITEEGKTATRKLVIQ